MIYAYLRLSTSENKQKNSFEVQLKEIKKEFNIGEIVKETISGAVVLNKREKLLELLEKLKKNDKIIVLRLDRISRDTVQSGWIRYEVERRGAELITLENTKKDNTSKLIENILLAFAQYERETTLWRINKSIENKKNKGEALGGNIAKFGYDFEVREDIKYLIENKREQNIIKRIGLFKNKTASKIAQILADDGVLGKGTKPIERKQVGRVLAEIEKQRLLKKTKIKK